MAQNVRPGRLDMSFKQFVDPPTDDSERTRTAVTKDDLLVTIVGANTGDVCRVPSQVAEHYVCQSVALIRMVDPSIAEYVECFLVAQDGGQKAFAKHIYGAGRPHLSFDQLKSVCVPLPPKEERELIVNAYRQLRDEMVQLSADLAAARRTSAKLRQSVLSAAFAGKLTQRDPQDETAGALLKRLREAKASAPVLLNKSAGHKRSRLSQADDDSAQETSL